MDKRMLLLGWGFFLLIIGYFLPAIKNKSVSRMVAWIPSAISIIISLVLTKFDSPIERTIGIIYLVLLSMKVIVLNETYSGIPKLNYTQWCVFSLGWFGMRPVLFESLPSKSLPSAKLFLKGVGAIVLGVILLHLSIVIESNFLHFQYMSYLALLLGLSMVLHFGILNLTAAGWRLFGVNVKELFVAPYQSKSIKEFWGKRWNIAFSEMTALIIFKPLKKKYNSHAALISAFLFSGLLHELAISFPVKSGYGLPLCYFIVHLIIMIIEDKVQFIKSLLSRPFFGYGWVAFWVIIPLPLLFHEAFMKEVIRPVRETILFFI